MLIKIKYLLMVAMLAAPIASRATDPAPSAAESAAASKTLQNLDRMIRELTPALSKAEQCFALESSLKSDHAKKKAQLTAEYSGKIPVAFTDLLFQKRERVAKQHKVCFQQYEALGGQFEAMDTAFRNIEPKSLNVKRQRATVDQAKQTYLQMAPTAKAYNKARKTKAEAN